MTVKLSPVFNEAQLDGSGNPWVGAKLFTYTAGSSTKQTTYQDSAGGSSHTNPIVLNSRGEPPAPIWLTSGVSYKFVLTSPTDSDPPVSPTRTVDNITGTNDTTVTLDEWVAGPAPTFVSTTSFTLVGDQTSAFNVGRRVKTTNSGGTIYSTIATSVFGAVTTVTVTNDSGVLDSGLSAVSYALQSATNPSFPGTVATLAGTQTLTNKTLTSPAVNTPTITGAVTGSTVAMGTGAGTGKHVVVASINTTVVGNVGAGTDDLMTYSLPANSLSAAGKAIRVTAYGRTANNANAKQLVFNFGANTSLSPALTANLAGWWSVEAIVTSTGTNTQDLVGKCLETTSAMSTTQTAMHMTNTATETQSGAITVKFTGGATTDNDITQEFMLVEFLN